MNASSFRDGDRVVLVSMNDRRYDGVERLGTVVGTCPPPINVVNVDWDDGFGLNPCLDEDAITKIGDVRDGREFYEVFTKDGEKMVRYRGFTWHRLAGDGTPCAVTTVDDCVLPVADGDCGGESLSERIAAMVEDRQQYQDDVSEWGFYRANLRFFGDWCGNLLDVDDVSRDTPDGEYFYEVSGQ